MILFLSPPPLSAFLRGGGAGQGGPTYSRGPARRNDETETKNKPEKLLAPLRQETQNNSGWRCSPLFMLFALGFSLLLFLLPSSLCDLGALPPSLS